MKVDLIKRITKIVIVLIVITLLLRYGGAIQHRVDIDKIQAFVESFGIWGVLVFIIFAALRPFLFIPSAITFVLGGVIFGTLLGSLVSLIGLLAGSSLCYLLASKFQGVFSKFVGDKYIAKLEKIKEKDAIKTLFMMRVTPGFPIDPVSYGAGLTGINYYDFFLGTLLGIGPKVFLYTFLGDGIEDLVSIRTIGVFIVLFLFALLPIFVKKSKLE